ncbi:hypothetical protein OG689_09305 [Kitasatospora sp. NBC_00240]|uniref:hypothetical protein n=1 Tax=Kitasatospora sp. NBC_00240 TaxID=2903567 RepID=UPI002255F245|nr:hypothetical protein [Kitasatospora sp. NBC_00240]MCX5209477.1 hypothetical protein [Kitasatospora sp. NBC_00240]
MPGRERRTGPWRGRRGGGPDVGTISLFVAVVATGFVTVIGIVVDAGGRLRAVERTDACAQEAARVAGQQLDEAGVLQGQGFKVRQEYVQRAAVAYLGTCHLVGGSGSAEIADGGTRVVVTVNATYEPALLDLVPNGGWGITGRGSALLVHGVKEAENG